MQRFTPELIDAARPSRHAVGDRWFVDETYVKVNGVWRYVYRAVDQHGQVIDVFVSKRRDIASARRFFTTALAEHRPPVEVITDRAAALANVIEELIPAVLHNTEQYENNRCECDHGRLWSERYRRPVGESRQKGRERQDSATARSSASGVNRTKWLRVPTPGATNARLPSMSRAMPLG